MRDRQPGTLVRVARLLDRSAEPLGTRNQQRFLSRPTRSWTWVVSLLLRGPPAEGEDEGEALVRIGQRVTEELLQLGHAVAHGLAVDVQLVGYRGAIAHVAQPRG